MFNFKQDMIQKGGNTYTYTWLSTWKVGQKSFKTCLLSQTTNVIFIIIFDIIYNMISNTMINTTHIIIYNL